MCPCVCAANPFICRVYKGLARNLIPSEEETSIAVKLLKGELIDGTVREVCCA